MRLFFTLDLICRLTISSLTAAGGSAPIITITLMVLSLSNVISTGFHGKLRRFFAGSRFGISQVNKPEAEYVHFLYCLELHTLLETVVSIKENFVWPNFHKRNLAGSGIWNHTSKQT